MNKVPEIGDRLKWNTLLDGKVCSVEGTIRLISDDLLHLRGITQTGVTVRDKIYSNDKSIQWL